MADEMSAKDKVFVDRYVQTLDPRLSALDAGYSLTVARSAAFQWVSDPKHKPLVYEAIQTGLSKRWEKMRVTDEQIIHRYMQIAFTDPNDLIETRHANCRYCWGEGHKYQWTPAEFEEAVKKAERFGDPLPDYGGGLEFKRWADPNPECPECNGKGEVHMLPKDSRDLSAGARALYAGIKPVKGGYEVKLHDQQKALEALAKMRGLFVERRELSGPGGKPLAATVLTTADPNEAAKAYAEMIKGE